MREPLKEYFARVGQRSLCDAWTLNQTYWTARALIEFGTPGDFIECGVFAGVHIAAMARACVDAGAVRTIRLFDSFEGIPRPGARDIKIRDLLGEPNGIFESSGVSVCSQEDVIRNLKEWDVDLEMLVFHPGWFEHSVPVARVEKIAYLRLDGDLYSSTLVCMEHLYPKLSRGGVCHIDDFNLDGCRAAVMEYLKEGLPGISWLKP